MRLKPTIPGLGGQAVPYPLGHWDYTKPERIEHNPHDTYPPSQFLTAGYQK